MYIVMRGVEMAWMRRLLLFAFVSCGMVGRVSFSCLVYIRFIVVCVSCASSCCLSYALCFGAPPGHKYHEITWACGSLLLLLCLLLFVFVFLFLLLPTSPKWVVEVGVVTASLLLSVFLFVILLLLVCLLVIVRFGRPMCFHGICDLDGFEKPSRSQIS